MTQNPTWLSFNRSEARTAAALFERLFPADTRDPGAIEIGVLDYLDRALAGPYQDHLEAYRLGLAALDRSARGIHSHPFADCGTEQQDRLIAQMERGELPDFHLPPQQTFFALLRAHLQEGLFADPAYGGNRDRLGWRFLKHPGVWLANSAEENLATEPVTKGGVIRSLADLGYDLPPLATEPAEIPGYDPQGSVAPPDGPVDVVLVGFGGMGSIVAPTLTKAGLRVVALEAGPWYTAADFLPDELGASYYGRANMGTKFMREVPRWRRNEAELTQAATFSLGRMRNGVGGSILHYGCWLRRFHPHHFKPLSRVRERWGEKVLPDDSTLADWPLTYEDLEPYYTQLEYLVGVAGNAGNPFIPRRQPFPMPPLRPCRIGELFSQVTRDMGLHPYPVPVGLNSIPYKGRPATTYSAWGTGFGSAKGDKWHAGLDLVPEALATGNLDLRTYCRVIRICTGGDGHASGVEYVNANGERFIQEARTIILCGYTFENIRLLLLSGDERHPNGLGNNAGQVGKNFMTKMFAHVGALFPDIVFNRHTGPSAQSIILDDFLADDFDSLSHGFIGGATPSVENQFLPLQISRETLPPDVPAWGQGYKDHLRHWQHLGVIRLQPDTLPYTGNYLDLDPVYRDRSGLGLPVIRITYDMKPNEHRLAEWMENKSEEILRTMGAARLWRGPRFTGVGSSHDLGGCRMAENPAGSVVNADLRVHDTPGLYVFSGAVFPSCPGVNPTLTMWALCLRAAEKLVERLRRGEEL